MRITARTKILKQRILSLENPYNSKIISFLVFANKIKPLEKPDETLRFWPWVLANRVPLNFVPTVPSMSMTLNIQGADDEGCGNLGAQDLQLERARTAAKIAWTRVYRTGSWWPSGGHAALIRTISTHSLQRTSNIIAAAAGPCRPQPQAAPMIRLRLARDTTVKTRSAPVVCASAVRDATGRAAAESATAGSDYTGKRISGACLWSRGAHPQVALSK